jgi:hypothetical protein
MAYKSKTEKKALPGLCRISVFIFSVIIFFTACGPDVKQPDTTTSTTGTTTVVTPPKEHVDPPVFDADSAYSFVKTQCDWGPRDPGSRAHEKCALWMEKKLKSYGAQTIMQTATLTTYDEKKWINKNVIGMFNPDAKDRVLLCCHWDSRPFGDEDTIPANQTKPIIGANDGASGVGVLLEVARALSKKKTNIGIDIIFFDLEDYGNAGSGDAESWCLGTQYWTKNLHKPQYFARFGILLDMVGGKNPTFPKEGSSVYYAKDVVDKIWSKAQLMGYGNYFTSAETGATTDDHVFINQNTGIPTIDIVQYDADKRSYFPFHHRAADNLDCIDKNTLGVVGKVLLEVIYNE